MLVGQHGGWDEHGHLLAVGGGLEGGADGDFGLAEAHVAADEAVHGLVRLHVGLDGLGGGQLVGGILIDERGLQLLLACKSRARTRNLSRLCAWHRGG